MTFRLETVETAASTMDLARERFASSAGPDDLFALAALSQTAGRGQRGRAWHTAPGESLAVTYCLAMAASESARVPHFAFSAGLAAAAGIEGAASLPTGTIRLKWPNDIMLNGRKLGGILIEASQADGGRWALLVGVGINVAARKLPPELCLSATSLALERISPPALHDLAARIGERLIEELTAWRSDPLPTLISRWRERDCTAGRRFRVSATDGGQAGAAAGIDECGRLLVDLDGGGRIAVSSASSLTDAPLDMPL